MSSAELPPSWQKSLSMRDWDNPSTLNTLALDLMRATVPELLEWCE
jgi:hypothetical protein